MAYVKKTPQQFSHNLTLRSPHCPFFSLSLCRHSLCSPIHTHIHTLITLSFPSFHLTRLSHPPGGPTALTRLIPFCENQTMISYSPKLFPAQLPLPALSRRPPPIHAFHSHVSFYRKYKYSKFQRLIIGRLLYYSNRRRLTWTV